MNLKPNISYKYKSPRSYQIPQQTWAQRNVRLIASVSVFSALLVFFSRPLYDIFLRPESEYLPAPTSKRQPK